MYVTGSFFLPRLAKYSWNLFNFNYLKIWGTDIYYWNVDILIWCCGKVIAREKVIYICRVSFYRKPHELLPLGTNVLSAVKMDCSLKIWKCSSFFALFCFRRHTKMFSQNTYPDRIIRGEVRWRVGSDGERTFLKQIWIARRKVSEEHY